MTLTVDKLNC